MKKIFAVCILILIVSLIGCGKQVVTQTTEPDVKKIESPLIGTWQYYADVPKMPYMKTWTLVFNEDGTYQTMGDDITMTDGVTKTGENVSAVWGPKGTYILSEDYNHLVMTKDQGKAIDRLIDIKEEEGVVKLMFLDKEGEVNVSANSDKAYYSIFIKQQ